MTRRKLLTALCLVLLAAGGVYALRVRAAGADLPPQLAFNGASSSLQHTQIVATLDAPVQKGKNAIWCAAFPAAWKKLQGLAGGPVQLEGAPTVASALNRAADPSPDAPPSALYTAAGWEDKGILNQIRADTTKQFPGSAAPTFSGIVPGSFVAYARLETRQRFGLPYFQSKKPLLFTGSDGKKIGVSSFGLREEDDYAYEKLRAQPQVLYDDPDKISHHVGKGFAPVECVIDLDCRSAPNQVIVALVKPPRTLADALALVERKIASPSEAPGRPGLGPNDVLLVPDVVWRLKHRFTELEQKRLGNATLKGQRLDVAQQDLLFRLDRSGAELRAEAKTYMQPSPTYYLFDHPFLIIMRARGNPHPYFVMWVDNAELLTRR